MNKRQMKKRVLSFLLFTLILLPGIAFASPIKIDAYTDKSSLIIGEPLKLTIKISGEVSGSLPDATVPRHEGFDLVSVPSQSSSFSWINGRVSASKTVNYTLIPRSIGTFIIGQSEVTFRGKTIISKPIEVKVEDRAETVYEEEDQDSVISMTADPHGRVIVAASLSKKQVYMGESVVYTFSFFHKVRLWENPEFDAPDFTGFLVESIPRNKGSREVIIKGERYRRDDIKKVIFPIREGDFTIDSTSITVQLDPFAKPVVLTTDPIELEVFPLPVGPENFKGAVGNFTIEASTDKDMVKSGEPVSVTVVLSGIGNIKTLRPPIYEASEFFRGYEPKDSVEISTLNDLVSGSKTFEFLFIPQKEGELSLPPFSLTFFDTAVEEYKTVMTKAISITALKADMSQGRMFSRQSTEPLLDKGDLKKRLRPIRMKSSLGNWNPKSYLNGINLVLILLPPIIFFAIFYYKSSSRKKTQEKNVLYLANASLKVAQELASEGNHKEFFSKTISALKNYLFDRIDMEVVEDSKDAIIELLYKTNFPKDLLQRIIAAFDTAEVGRFSPVKYDEKEMEAFLFEIRSIIESFENLKVKKGGSK